MSKSKKNPLWLYAYVTQLLIMLAVLTVGGYLLGRYVIFKTTLAAGIIATIGAIAGVGIFVLEMIKLGNEKEEQ